MQSTNPKPKKQLNPNNKRIADEREINHIRWTSERYASVVDLVADGEFNIDLKLNAFDHVYEDLGQEKPNKPILYYGTKQIVTIDERDLILKDLYYSIDSGLCGADVLFKKVNEKYLGISQLYVREWLHRQELAQRFKPGRALVVVRPYTTYRPRITWQMDLIDFGEHFKDGQYRYILSVIDVFSKKVWLRGLTQKLAANVANGVSFQSTDSDSTSVKCAK